MPASLLQKCLGVSLLLAPVAGAVHAGQYQNFGVAVYVRAYEVQKMKDPAWLAANWAIVEKQLKVDKVYLEPHRDLIIVDDATLQAARAFFAAKGVATAAGIAYVKNERNLFETFCYTKAEDRAKVKEIAEVCARNFDEVILDDFFFTSCKCAECVKAKGDRSWAEYRLALLTEVSQHLVIDAARAVNPKVKLTIKYPNWYEHFHGMGYNLEAQPKMFDRIHAGTETRNSDYNHQHLQPYHGYQQIRYFENIAPGRANGGWVDSYGRGVADRYAEQLWLTMLAKAPEMILFAMHELVTPLAPTDRAPWQGQGTSFDFDAIATPVAGVEKTTLARVAGAALEQIDPVVGKLGTPIGIASYRPYHSSSDEDFIHNYLGGLGLPIDLRPEFPAEAPMVLLTAGAATDPQLVAKIKARLLAGKDVLITSGLLREIQDRGFRREIAEVVVTAGKTSTQEMWGYPLGWGAKVALDRPILLPELRYHTNDSWEMIATMTNGLGFPVVHYVPFAGAKLYVLTVPDNLAELYRFPAPVLNFVRQIASKGLFARLEGPAQVALMAYDNRAVVVESFRDEAAAVRVVTGPEIAKMRNVVTGEIVEGKLEKVGGGMMGPPPVEQRAFAIPLKPHSFVALVAE